MAFKIKSAKIFFFGIKEHTVMLLSVVLSDLRRQTGPLQDINRKRKRGVAVVIVVVVPASCESGQAPDEGHAVRGTAVRHLVKAWPREGEAAEFSRGKAPFRRSLLMMRPQFGLPCKL